VKHKATNRKTETAHDVTGRRAAGRRRVIPLPLIALTPPALFGIAVGAMTVLLKLADPSLHRLGLWLIWVPTALVSVLAIAAGVIEARIVLRSQSKGESAAESSEAKDRRE
jgi:hypothetical protein